VVQPTVDEDALCLHIQEEEEEEEEGTGDDVTSCGRDRKQEAVLTGPW